MFEWESKVWRSRGGVRRAGCIHFVRREKSWAFCLKMQYTTSPFTCCIAPYSWDGRPSGRELLQIAETGSGLSHKLRHAGKGNRKRYLQVL